MKLTTRYLGHPDRPVIGELFEAADQRIYFQFDPTWRDRNLELSPFYLPASSAGSLSTPTPSFGPLFGLFDDSLPDWWGEQLLKKFFDENGIRWARVGALQKLAAQGDYGIGALGYEPDEAPADFRAELSVDVARLVDAARSVVEGSPEKVLPQLIRSGMSPGGAQPKALIHLSHDLKKAWPGGATPPSDTEPWLIKFQIDRDIHITREEHAFALMARAAGIDVPETRLLTDSSGGVHFITRRFDRDQGERRHVHTFSGLTHTPVRDGLEYGDLMDVARTLCESELAVEEIFRRAVFNIAAGNNDDHGRNHAFVMDSTGQWTPSPAYDLTFASHPLASNLRSASVMGRFAAVSRRDLVELGKSQAVRKVDDTVEKVLAAIHRWPEFASEAGIPEFHAEWMRSEFPATEW